jgi:hypothetical protein
MSVSATNTKSFCDTNKMSVSATNTKSFCDTNKMSVSAMKQGEKKRKKASNLRPLVRGRRWPVGLLYREGLLRKGAI